MRLLDRNPPLFSVTYSSIVYHFAFTVSGPSLKTCMVIEKQTVAATKPKFNFIQEILCVITR
jgi:hypothetical protein